MKQVAFDDLAKLPVIQYYETAFRKATGVSLKVVPPDDGGKPFVLETAGNPFCASLAGCEACRQAEGRARRSAARKLAPQ
jgi:hypothetical protein